MAKTASNILFAISDTGGGHRSAAVAISAALEELRGDALHCSILDVLRATGVPMVRNAPDLYDQLSTRWLRVYDLTFQMTNGVRRVDALSRVIFLQARRKLARELITAQPDLIVVTHPLVNRLVCAVRRTHRLPIQVITVVTDLVSLHASWTYPGVDLCLVPTQEAYRLMLQRGMRAERMLRTGFPVHPKFVRYARSRDEARRDLNLAADRVTIMLTGGGVGSGNLRDQVLHLEQACREQQILVVTGKNHQLYQELKARVRHPYMHIYGFVDNMEALMAASDIVVTKAGPGTLMEALVMRKPVIVTEAVGRQEHGNIDFVLNRDLGAFCPTSEQIVRALAELAEPQRYHATVRRLEDAVPREGAYQIAELLLDRLENEEGYTELGPRRRQMPTLGGLRALRRRIARPSRDCRPRQ
jgi:1,2-diacylglycerol 3-beta-galactosyltransferase